MPHSHAWTARQKTLIALAVLLGVIAFAGVVYSYERYHRGLQEADLAGTWTRIDPGTGGGYYEFRRDGVIVLLDEKGQPTQFKGKWYAGGPNIYVRFPPNVLPGRPQLAIWHILDISKDEFRVSPREGEIMIWQRIKPPAASNPYEGCQQ